MKVSVLYRPDSDHQRAVLNFSADFKRQTTKEIELISVDTVEGDAKARLYDITRYPAVIATDDQGKLLKLWVGKYLPLIQEVSYYQR